jgi:hypothetical protein
MQGQLDQMKAAAAQTERAIAATNRLAENAAAQSEAARQIAKAAIIANQVNRHIVDEATEANTINKKAIAGVQRAFIVSNGVRFESTPSPFNTPKMTIPPIWTAFLEMENSGNTPTEKLLLNARCVRNPTSIDEPTILKPRTVFDAGVSRKDTFGPRQSKVVTSCSLLSVPTAITKSPDAFWVYIFGTAEYEDEFNRNVAHITEFCYAIPVVFVIGRFAEEEDFRENSVSLCNVHNCIDEQCRKDDLAKAQEDLGLSDEAP